MKSFLKLSILLAALVSAPAANAAVDQSKYCSKIFLHCSNQLSGIFKAQDNTIANPTPEAYSNLLESQQRTYDRCIADLQEEGCI